MILMDLAFTRIGSYVAISLNKYSNGSIGVGICYLTEEDLAHRGPNITHELAAERHRGTVVRELFEATV